MVKDKERKLPTCNRERSRPCGRACISLLRNCRSDPGYVAKRKKASCGVKKKRVWRPPNCTPGITRRCGKVCRGLDKVCKQPGYEYTPDPPVRLLGGDTRVCKNDFSTDSEVRQSAKEMVLAREALKESKRLYDAMVMASAVRESDEDEVGEI